MSQLQIKKATRQSKKLRCLITAVSGGGKSLGSLLLAKGLTDNGKVLVFDTENGRASLKADNSLLTTNGWSFDVVEVDPDTVTSQLYIDAINLAEKEGYDCIILDSISHDWSYVKDLHQKLGGRFTDWMKAKESHHRLIRKIISSSIHVISTARSDIKHEQQEGSNGKKQVVKLGLATQQESNFPYEMDFVIDILGRDHYAIADKYEEGTFDNKDPFIITEETGRLLNRWLNNGEGISKEEQTKKVYLSKILEYQTFLLEADPSTAETSKSLDELEAMSLEELTNYGKMLKVSVEKISKK